MMELPYSFVVARTEKDLITKLSELSAKTGYTFKIISIYPRGEKVFAWYYSSKRT